MTVELAGGVRRLNDKSILLNYYYFRRRRCAKCEIMYFRAGRYFYFRAGWKTELPRYLFKFGATLTIVTTPEIGRAEPYNLKKQYYFVVRVAHQKNCYDMAYVRCSKTVLFYGVVFVWRRACDVMSLCKPKPGSKCQCANADAHSAIRSSIRTWNINVLALPLLYSGANSRS